MEEDKFFFGFSRDQITVVLDLVICYLQYWHHWNGAHFAGRSTWNAKARQGYFWSEFVRKPNCFKSFFLDMHYSWQGISEWSSTWSSGWTTCIKGQGMSLEQCKPNILLATGSEGKSCRKLNSSFVCDRQFQQFSFLQHLISGASISRHGPLQNQIGMVT